MRDIVLSSIIIMFSTYGFFIKSFVVKKAIPHIIALLIGVSCILLINVFIEIRFLYNIFIFSGLMIGYLFSYFNPVIFFSIFSIGFTGAFTLSSHANQYTMLICLIFYFVAGFAIISYKKPEKKAVYILFLSLGLLAYFVLYIIMVGDLFLNGISVSILALILGAYLKRNSFYILFIPTIVLLMYFSFIFYPDSTINVAKTYLPSHNINDFSFASENEHLSDLASNSDLVLIETWHQYCSKCFLSMDDFHYFFKEKSNDISFQHYYLFVGTDMEPDLVYNFEHLPGAAENIVIDKKLEYYNSLAMQGAPYFNFYKNGEYLFSYSGYNQKYQGRYRKLFEELLSKNGIVSGN